MDYQPHTENSATLYSQQFEEALGRIYAIHRTDPRIVERDGVKLPWSVFYHRRLAHWVNRLKPNPPEAMALAAACQHIRRWQIPRNNYPKGRDGYKNWRRDLARFHSEQARDILASLEYEQSMLDRITDFIEKRGFKTDPEVQLFEDAICLTFLEGEFAEFAEGYSREQLWRIIDRTWKKMSAAGHTEAIQLMEELPAHLQNLLKEVTSSEGKSM